MYVLACSVFTYGVQPDSYNNEMLLKQQNQVILGGSQLAQV